MGEDTQIKPEDRFENITIQDTKDREAFDNLVKDLGIPTLEDLKKGENYSAYLIKTDYITEPEPHPYKEILNENHITIKDKIFEKIEEEEPTRKEIDKLVKKEKIQDEIPKEEIKVTKNEKKKKTTPAIQKVLNTNKKIMTEKITSSEKTIKTARNQIIKAWTRNNKSTSNSEQKNEKDSKCNWCDTEMFTREKLVFHKSTCKKKTIVATDSKDIKPPTVTPFTYKEES